METNLVEVVCDRCHKPVHGMEFPATPGKIGGTAGFYRTDDPDGWGQFSEPDEDILCDNCMQSDKRYQDEYK